MQVLIGANASARVKNRRIIASRGTIIDEFLTKIWQDVYERKQELHDVRANRIH